MRRGRTQLLRQDKLDRVLLRLILALNPVHAVILSGFFSVAAETRT